jgi:hypothetical protein
MVRGVDTTNKTMSGGRISRANNFVDKARAISNAARAEHDHNRKVASAQKEVRIREDAMASGWLSEHDAAMQEAKLKREAKAAKSAMFLAQAQLAASELDTRGETESHGAQPVGVVLSIRPGSAEPASVLLTICPLREPETAGRDIVHGKALPRATRKGEEGSDAPVRRHANAVRIVRAAPRPRRLEPPSPGQIAALVRHPSSVARAPAGAALPELLVASEAEAQCRSGGEAAVPSVGAVASERNTASAGDTGEGQGRGRSGGKTAVPSLTGLQKAVRPVGAGAS